MKDLSCKFNFESVVGSAVTHKFIVKKYKEGAVAEGESNIRSNIDPNCNDHVFIFR